MQSLGSILVGAAIVIPIWMLILQAAISYSTKTKERLKIEQAQLFLLGEIAKKLGVDEQEVKKYVDWMRVPQK